MLSKLTPHQKYILPISFSLIILIMIFTSLSAVLMMQNNSEKIIEALNVQNLSHKLIKEMTDAADRRSSIIFEMIHTDDPFKNDDLFLELNTVGTAFTIARIEFNKQEHNHSCKPILVRQGEISKINAPLQLKVYEFMQNGEKDKAINLFINTTLPKQKEVTSLLDDISKMEFDLFNEASHNLKNDNKIALTNILIFDSIGILFSILLTFFVEFQCHR